MARVWGVQDSDDKLSGWVSEDETDTAPTGETAVLESVIRAADPPGADGRIQSGGHWDGTTYTPPVGDEFFQPFDASTPLGQKQKAAQELHDDLDSARELIMQVAPEKIQSHVQRLLEFEAMAHWANYVVAHMTSITSAQFVAWAQKMREGPSGVTSLQTLFEAVHLIPEAGIPQEACAWVNPTDTTEVIQLKDARDESTQGENAWFDGETVDLYDVDLGNGAWIGELIA